MPETNLFYKKATISYNLLYGFTSLVGVVLVALTLTWIIIYKNGFAWSSSEDGQQLNWHILLMILGLVFLYSQSILIYRTGGYIIPKNYVKYIHDIMHWAIFIISFVGLDVTFQIHSRLSLPHLKSLHSWVGLGTAVIFAAQLLAGFAPCIFPGLAQHLRKLILQPYVGTLTFIMALLSTLSGIHFVLGTSWDYITFLVSLQPEFPSEIYFLNFLGVIVIIYGVLTTYLLVKPEYKRQLLPEDL